MFSDANESQHSELMHLSTTNKHTNTNINIADAQTPLIDDGTEEDILIPEGGHVEKNKLGTINGCYGMLHTFSNHLFLIKIKTHMKYLYVKTYFT